jgi:hypothetical protein
LGLFSYGTNISRGVPAKFGLLKIGVMWLGLVTNSLGFPEDYLSDPRMNKNEWGQSFLFA